MRAPSETDQDEFRFVLRALALTAVIAVCAYYLLLGVIGWREVYEVGSGNVAGYPFGWEGGGWRYRTAESYLLTAWIEAVLATLLLGSLLVRRRMPWMFWSLLALMTIVQVLLATLE